MLLRTRKIILPLLLASFLLTSSCTVKWVADYDAELSAEIQETAKKADLFLLTMMETSTNNDESRNYSNFSEGYAIIEADIQSILLKNKIRPLNSNSVRINEIVLELWKDYKNEHKADTTISDGIITLNRDYMQGAFRALLIAEEGKNYQNPNGD